MEDHVEREFCREQCEEPLGSVHVCFKANVQKVVIQIRNVFLITIVDKERKKVNLHYLGGAVETPKYYRSWVEPMWECRKAGFCIHP